MPVKIWNLDTMENMIAAYDQGVSLLEKGLITQDKADEILAQLQAQIQEIIDTAFSQGA